MSLIYEALQRAEKDNAAQQVSLLKRLELLEQKVAALECRELYQDFLKHQSNGKRGKAK